SPPQRRSLLPSGERGAQTARRRIPARPRHVHTQPRAAAGRPRRARPPPQQRRGDDGRRATRATREGARAVPRRTARGHRRALGGDRTAPANRAARGHPRARRLRLDSGDATRALEYADAAAALDASNERPVQLALEAEAALGRRDAVADRYERLARELDERFGLEPSRETKTLYRRLLSQDAAAEKSGSAREHLVS